MSGVLITGAAGYVGSLLHRRLKENSGGTDTVNAQGQFPKPLVGTDIHFAGESKPDQIICDITDAAAVDQLFASQRPDLVFHLASMVNPTNAKQRKLAYAVDVEGTMNILQACIRYGVRRLVVTSSGAAYGYHADNPVPMSEEQPLKPYTAFPYSHHKQLVEKMLADHVSTGLGPEIVILRSGTIVGQTTRNQITALFEKPRLLAIRGSDSPFVFIWDEDVVGALMHAGHLQDLPPHTSEESRENTAANSAARSARISRSFLAPPGIYNLAGDGWLTVRDLAGLLNKEIRWLPAGPLKLILGLARPLRLSRYGPEQIDFLRYRPVLDNTRLKEVFGYSPAKSSLEAFLFYAKSAGLIQDSAPP
ncbi:MAG: NAD-dependent epimerase/dehydratase family protein [Leptospiraceae bacterium]|nr:NAD-dependent epimerase/dehydratase family protein [Leptospiraceae bacterium]MCB1171235.1 NAD-dependent epimerase/dehydratase family protein [Leptospiraceae bacterium]